MEVDRVTVIDGYCVGNSFRERIKYELNNNGISVFSKIAFPCKKKKKKNDIRYFILFVTSTSEII